MHSTRSILALGATLLSLASPHSAQDAAPRPLEAGATLQRREWYDVGRWPRILEGSSFVSRDAARDLRFAANGLGDPWDRRGVRFQQRQGLGRRRVEWDPTSRGWRLVRGFDDEGGPFDDDLALEGDWNLSDSDGFGRGSFRAEDFADDGTEPDPLPPIGPRVLVGSVASTWNVFLEGQRQAQAMLSLRQVDGTATVVSLGPWATAARLHLKRGDTITVVGSMGQIDGRAVFFASRVAARRSAAPL